MLESVHRKLTGEDRAKWLMVIDNIDDKEVLFRKDETRSGKRLYDYFPCSRHGMILFTTRSRSIAAELVTSDFLHLQQMNTLDSRQLLKKSLKEQREMRQDQLVEDLLQRLTYLPLAIVQAAAFMNKNSTTISKYLGIMRDTDQGLIEALSKDFDDSNRDRDSRNAVTTTWMISFRQIQKYVPFAAKYLSFLACVAPQDIPRSIFPAVGSDLEQEEAIGTLLAYNFMTKQSNTNYYDVHILVHQVTSFWLRNNGQWDNCIQDTISRLIELIPWDGNKKSHHEYTPALQHGYYTSHILESKDSQPAIKLLDRVGGCYIDIGNYIKAEDALADVVERRKKAFGPEHRQTMDGMHYLGRAIAYQGRYRDAERIHQETLLLREKELGPQHGSTLASRHELAMMALELGKYNNAEKLLIQLIETRKRVLGAEHPSTLTSQANLASTYRKQGRWKEAESLDMQVIDTRKRVLGAEHPNTLISIETHAFTLDYQNRCEEAIRLMESCVDLSIKVLGPEHYITKEEFLS
jgi:tetratricopeptide (TPR) repeat protein